MTQAGTPVAGARIVLLVNGKSAGFTTRANASGSYSVVLKKTGKKTTSTFQARTTVAERDVTTTVCASPDARGPLRERNCIAVHSSERQDQNPPLGGTWRTSGRRRGPLGPVSYAGTVAEIRIGTCSWADDALSKHWYPPGVKAGDRLPYYAGHFDTVEVDSTYYRLPDEEMVRRWAERTPDGFVMHVKAFGLMTRHPVKLESLPPGPARRCADRRAGTGRAAVARVSRRGLPQISRCARAAALQRQARRHPLPVSLVRGLQGPFARLPAMGA